MNYITVNKSLLLIPQSKSANMEALLLYYIRTKCNKDNASAIGEKRIQDELELPESTVEGYIKKLKEYTDILSIRTLIPSNKNDRAEIEKILGLHYDGDGRKKNVYYFDDPETFYYLKPSIIYRTDIDNEIKGFLIRLACLCDLGTTKIYTANSRKGKANISSIASDLKISREKATSLLNRCEKMGLIKPIPRGYIILEDSFLLNTEKTCEDIVYNTIYKHCLDKGAVPPNRYEFNRKGQSIECEGLTMLTPVIFSKWSMHIEEANKKKEPSLKFNEYIRDVLLSNRFPTLPEEPHWEYFKKAILNIKPKQSPSKQWCSTL